ncbi:MAG: DUF6049 family protein [Acidimicrobiales bacterium]
MRWARISICALVMSVVLLVAIFPRSTGERAGADTAGDVTVGPALSLAAQTAWVSPAAPWFALTAEAGSGTGPIDDLHVEVTFYNRINDETELAQATHAVPEKGVLDHFNTPVTTTPNGRVAATCATVVRSGSETPPTTAPPNTLACPPGSPTLILGCTPDEGICGGVYPVSVALYRQGTDAPLARFTTFLTYQEPGISASDGAGGPLRVALVMPVSGRLSPTSSLLSGSALEPVEDLTGIIAAHRGVAVSLAANPATVASLGAGGKKGRRAVTQLRSLTAAPVGDDQLLAQSYVPINVAGLADAGLTDEIGAQMARGTALLDAAGLHPTSGTWVDTSSDFTTGGVSDLGDGLQAAHADNLILDDADLAPLPAGPTGPKNLTFAQPFSLGVGDGRHVTAAGASSEVDALFTADPDDPVLAANQMIATLEFIHFENAYETDPRGIVVEPPASWQPSDPLLTTLLTELAGNPVLSPVTLSQFFAQVPKGGNEEPASRRLQAGSPAKSGVIAAATARHLAAARAHLTSFSQAVGGHQHPAVFVELSDLLLATENKSFDPAERAAAFAVFIQRFGVEVNLVSLAAQNTITFTSRTASIPVSVLSSAPFPVKVVLSLSSDKFAFPDGSARTLTLDHPTTPVRIAARAITSGDRLPVEVTLTTPDGQLVFARATLTVHSTSISIVGIALTVVAALVLLVWWARTWRKGRKKRPRAA